jgi:hypothetical protein
MGNGLQWNSEMQFNLFNFLSNTQPDFALSCVFYAIVQIPGMPVLKIPIGNIYRFPDSVKRCKHVKVMCVGL